MIVTTQYVIKYTVNGERRFELARLENGTEAEARAVLEAMHDKDDVIVDVKVSKAL